MKRVITYGTFDLLHYGHINLLKRAKAFGDYLIVAISSDEFNWKEIFLMSYKTTIDITLRNFQFKYINRIIATNKYLFKCKLCNSNLCDFCGENIETIEHLFWECKYIQPIWNQLTSFLGQQQLNVKLSFLNVSFGTNTLKSIDGNNIVNFILILMKYFIFNMKYRKQIPNFNCFVHSLKLKIQIEKEIALSNDTLHICEQKWNRIKFSWSSSTYTLFTLC